MTAYAADPVQEPIAPPGDTFGNVIDDRTVEAWLSNALRAWIDSHLAHQERRWQLTPGTIQRPATWPTLSQFRLDLEDQLPAVILVFTGEVANSRKRMAGGGVRKAYAYDISVAVVGGGDEPEDDARATASMYIAAVESIIEQNGTLDGRADTTVAVGPLAPAAGQAIGDNGQNVGERALYRTTVHVYVRDTVNARLGPSVPPDDPYQPAGPPPVPETVEVIDIDTQESL